jgi:ABC-2 type transport system permease protein
MNHVLRDTGLVYRRYLGMVLRNPVWIAIGVIQPVIYLLLFAPLLKPIATTLGFSPAGAYNFFVPGLLMQLGMFGAAGVGFSLISELREGVIERLRVTPISRASLLLGRALRDVMNLLIQAMILIALALPFGLSIQWGGLLIVLALVALVGVTTACISYALALALRDEDSFAPLIFTVALPLLLLSGVLLPLKLGPVWLRDVADFNPLYYAVNAARDVFVQHLGTSSVIEGVAVMAVLALVMIVVAARSFGRAVS